MRQTPPGSNANGRGPANHGRHRVPGGEGEGAFHDGVKGIAEWVLPSLLCISLSLSISLSPPVKCFGCVRVWYLCICVLFCLSLFSLLFPKVAKSRAMRYIVENNNSGSRKNNNSNSNQDILRTQVHLSFFRQPSTLIPPADWCPTAPQPQPIHTCSCSRSPRN